MSKSFISSLIIDHFTIKCLLLGCFFFWQIRMEKINKPGKISEFYVASATIEQAIIAAIAIFGIRFYAKVSLKLFAKRNKFKIELNCIFKFTPLPFSISFTNVYCQLHAQSLILLLQIARLVVILPHLSMSICIICMVTKFGIKNIFLWMAEGLWPDAQKLLHVKVWITAALQVFFFFSLKLLIEIYKRIIDWFFFFLF